MVCGRACAGWLTAFRSPWSLSTAQSSVSGIKAMRVELQVATGVASGTSFLNQMSFHNQICISPPPCAVSHTQLFCDAADVQNERRRNRCSMNASPRIRAVITVMKQ